MQSFNFAAPAALTLVILAYYLRLAPPMKEVSQMMYYMGTEPTSRRMRPGSHLYMGAVVVGFLAVLVPAILVFAPLAWLYRRSIA